MVSNALLDLIKKSKNKHTRTGNSAKLKEGKTTVRLLTLGGDSANQFWRDIGVHWIKTDINGKPVAVLGCRQEIYGEPCEIDDAIEQAVAAAASDEEMELIKSWKAKKSVLVNALIGQGKDRGSDPEILEVPPSVWGDMMGMIAEYLDSGVDLLDAKTGQDFVVERRGKGLDTKYTVMLAPKSHSVPEDVYKRLHDLDQYIESQYFRGDEKKALNAIANVTGITISAGNQIAAPRRSPMLTAPAAQVEDAEVAEAADAIIEAEAEAKVEPAPAVPESAPAVEEEDEEAALAKRLAEIQAKKAAAKKAEAAKKAAAEAAKPVETPAPEADDIDSILDELDNIDVK